jgi:hypothetical protein
MKHLNYYTVYNQEGLHMGSHEDKQWAEFTAKEYNGHIVMSDKPIPNKDNHVYYSNIAKKTANHHRRVLMRSFVYALCCVIIILYGLVYKIMTEPFNMYVHLAFMFFGIIGCVFIYLLSHAERGDV